MKQLSPKLLIVDKDRNFLNFMNCKIRINKITKKIVVRNKESKKISISFKRKFIFSRNILCALNSSNDTNYYFLFLPSEEICTKILNIVQKNTDVDAHGKYRYRKLIEKILRTARIKTKLLKDFYVVEMDEKNEIVLRDNTQNRKRNIADIGSDDSSDDESDAPPSKKSRISTNGIMMKEIYKEPYFAKVMADRKGKHRPRLLIFPNNDKTYHFEYYWSKKYQNYQCCGCGKKAEMLKDENEKEFVKSTATMHYCKLRKYDHANYVVDFSTRIVENENFKIIKYTQKGITTSKLFIFDPTNKNLCRGYFWDIDNHYYLCIGCNAQAQRIFAKLCQNQDGIEYLMLSKNQHVCDLREYNIDKYKSDIIVKKPMYQHVEHTVAGTVRKYLLIFIDKTKKLCYKFSYENGYQPICCRCSSKNLYIQAYILIDSNGNEYVSIKDKKHICEPMEYNPNDYADNQIINKPRYQVIKRHWKGKFVEKLVVFNPDDNNLCYEYTLQRSQKYKSFKCNECHHKHSVSVFARIINPEKENEHVELSKTPHKCIPAKFEDPNSSILNFPNFKIIKSVTKGESKKVKDHLLIFSSIDKNLCYRYYDNVSTKTFTCLGCDYQRKQTSAKIYKNENGEDFVQLGECKHVCEPEPEKEVLKKISGKYNIIK